MRCRVDSVACLSCQSLSPTVAVALAAVWLSRRCAQRPPLTVRFLVVVLALAVSSALSLWQPLAVRLVPQTRRGRREQDMWTRPLCRGNPSCGCPALLGRQLLWLRLACLHSAPQSSRGWKQRQREQHDTTNERGEEQSARNGSATAAARIDTRLATHAPQTQER